MAAARQKEMKDSITVVATTTLTVAARCWVCTEDLSWIALIRRRLSNSPTRLADGLELESTPSLRTAPRDTWVPRLQVEFGDFILA